MAKFFAIGQDLESNIFANHDQLDEIERHLQLVASKISSAKDLVSQVKLPPIPDADNLLQDQQAKHNETVARKMSEVWVKLGVEQKILDDPALLNLAERFNDLDKLELKLCWLSFAIFPDNAVIRKRPLIYWWIAEGFVPETSEGERVFLDLINEGLVKPANRSGSPIINRCKIHPWVRRMLIMLAKKGNFFDFASDDSRISRCECLVSGKESSFSDIRSKEERSNKGESKNEKSPPRCFSNWKRFVTQMFKEDRLKKEKSKEEKLQTVFNVSEQYLSFKPNWLSNLKRIAVLQLGRWQSSAEHHIEIEDEKSLNGLGAKMHLRYLSLHGISLITKLPDNVVNLINLQILDLRACHNLEELPPDISSLKNLTHLDLSECYLIGSMPKGLEKLSELRVLKGFVIGKSRKSQCKLANLTQLSKLMKLSLYIVRQAGAEEEDFSKLKEIAALQFLTISWREKSAQLEDAVKFLAFPDNLTKLDLRCIPHESRPEWLKPSKLMKLEKLYIRGGNLSSLHHGDDIRWKAKILRLKYLKNLKVQKSELLIEFPRVIFLEKISCHKSGKDQEDEDFVYHKVTDTTKL